VEWLGQRLNIGSMAVGTILAAFGTALPESVVTLVAVTTGPTAEIRNIGVGAAMDGPLVLATVAYGAPAPCCCFGAAVAAARWSSGELACRARPAWAVAIPFWRNRSRLSASCQLPQLNTEGPGVAGPSLTGPSQAIL
jgi:hypothetical protein